MSIQAETTRLPKRLSLRAVFARIVGFLGAVYDAFTEAQIKAHEARRRYPYMNSHDN